MLSDALSTSLLLSLSAGLGADAVVSVIDGYVSKDEKFQGLVIMILKSGD